MCGLIATCRSGVPCPAEYVCHVRRRLHSTLPTVATHPDICLIDDAGANLEEAGQATAFALIDTAFGWFDAFRDPAKVLAMLQDREVPPRPRERCPR